MVPAEGAFLTSSGVEFMARSGGGFPAPLNRNESRTNHKRTRRLLSSTGSAIDFRCTEPPNIERTDLAKYDTSAVPMFASRDLRNFGSCEVTKRHQAAAWHHISDRSGYPSSL